MSKNIRKIIAAIFVMSAFLIIEPNCLNLTNAKVYAEEKPHLKSIYLSEGDDIGFSADINSYIVDVDKDVEEIFIKAKPDDLLDTVKINGKIVSKDDYYKQNLVLKKGKNTIKIEIQDDKTKDRSMYEVYVYRGGKEAVYLNDILINGSSIGFDKSSNFYNIELDEGTELVNLSTIPGEGSYTISANGTVLNETNSIKLKFKGLGKYTINIGLKDEDTERTGIYTLNIYLGIPVSPNIGESINKVLKPNQWVVTNGRWKYNDALGEPLKNIWFYDNKYNKYFHFNSRGNMQTGWLEADGKEYYLNPYGEMQTGWIRYEDEWYFFGPDGAMKNGWIKDDEKWYSLRKNGTMAKGWIVSNDNWYYLNSCGTMQTGWIYYGKRWYYLNSYGTMQTGWFQYENDWYYLNSNGDMKSGEWLYDNNKWYYFNYYGNMRCDNINIKNSGWLLDKNNKYYYFNEDGTMRTSSKTMDGYTYEFNEDGSASNV